MKIVEYTLGLPPYRRGGLPRYSTDLSLELAKTDEVFLMYPGSINPFSSKIKINTKKSKYPFKVLELKNGLPVSLGLGIDANNIDKFIAKRNIDEFKRFIDREKPDVVHFHTLMGAPIEMLAYLHREGVKTVFTTHDFYGLCPKMLAKNPILELTSSACTDDCMLCKNGPSYKKLLVMQTHLYEHFKESKLIKKVRKNRKTQLNSKTGSEHFTIEQARLGLKIREYYLEMYRLIDDFHFNSSVAQDYIMQFLPDVKGKVVPITHSGLKDNRNRNYEKHDKLVVGYVGPYDHKKGFYRLAKIAEGMPDVVFRFYGDVVENPVFKKSNIENHGVVSPASLQQAYRDMDVLVVPSLWHETFGFVVLEALLQGTPCIVSDTVGAKDFLINECIFNNDSELEEKLNKLKNEHVLNQLRKKVNGIKIAFNMNSHAKICKNNFFIKTERIKS
ncbi:glycosyltransferase [Limosilactobacillus reuteri]|uniref:glycosyltransferase n=1 Tax=Limosilactobacillus reuteri TaxID=1598 RepID=UPI001E4C55FF|nr:glycosyltransferase [Limosilactobacillus reuteri]MCC4414513.1 glycosyltransferase [Limosilactobacillus reuteri]